MSDRNQSLIKNAVRLLIRIFWTQDGRKDWAEIMHDSQDVWRSMHNIPGLEKTIVNHTVNQLLGKYSPFVLQQEIESEFVRIFVNTRGGVSTPLYHSCYYDDQKLLMKKPALEMFEMLEHAGITLGPDIGEPPDHLCIELEYLYFLLNHGTQNSNQEIQDHVREFARDFMLPWITRLQKQIPDSGPALFFTHSAQALVDLLRFLGQVDQT